MKSKQTPINARPKRRPQLPAAAEDVAFAIEEQVIWRGEDALRSAGGAVRRGLDRALWTLQRRLLWPLQDRARELEGPGRVVATATLLLIAATAGVAGLLWAASGGSGSATRTQVADTQVTQVPAPAPPPKKETATPTLHGAAPVFAPADGQENVGAAKGVETSATQSASSSSSEASASTAASGSAATGKISSSPSASASSAQAATASGPPAGPAAIAVAREFADAFVVYEIGGTEAKVRDAFHATASRQLARSLLRRPPKQPASVKVPKAKVVNVVAAPSHGSVYPVSVSLLRVGVTSELRLEMEKTPKHGWQVTNALG